MFCNGNNFSDIPTTALLGMSGTMSSLSICGALLILLTFIIIPEIRNTTRTLVTCLTIADLLTSVGMHFSNIESNLKKYVLYEQQTNYRF